MTFSDFSGFHVRHV